jgi:hypothetical protein
MRESGKERVEKVAESFVELMSSFKEKKMRQVLLAERLNKLNIETISEVLHYFVTRSEEDDLRLKPVIACLLDVPYLVSALGNEKMSRVYEKLEVKGYYNVRALLVPHPHIKRRGFEDDIISFPDMEEIPLGVKKTLAKSDKKHKLDKLLYEDNPVIIRNLLNNPRITEKDVLKIVTRRPIKKNILMEVVNSKRWLDRHIIKKAIARNPFTPTEIALNMLHFMLLQDLLVIANDGRLNYAVRDLAQNLIEKKRKLQDEEDQIS